MFHKVLMNYVGMSNVGLEVKVQAKFALSRCGQ